MGHLLHGTSLALPSHVERYGFRTISGSTGGVSMDASVKLSRLAATARMVGERMAPMPNKLRRPADSNGCMILEDGKPQQRTHQECEPVYTTWKGKLPGQTTRIAASAAITRRSPARCHMAGMHETASSACLFLPRLDLSCRNAWPDTPLPLPPCPLPSISSLFNIVTTSQPLEPS